MIADAQALTDNADNPEKVRQNIMQVALDYLAVGIDPSKATIFIQSQVPALAELTVYYMNLVTVSRVQRNPTVKAEIQQKNFEASVPVGFFCYPISQAADITAFHATSVPVGEDQEPMLEQCREIVHKFNEVYGETLTMPEIYLSKNAARLRLPGLDGKAKMSKSLGNCIYLADDEKTVQQKVMSMYTAIFPQLILPSTSISFHSPVSVDRLLISFILMYTDPTHLKVSDPGHIEGNTVFTYLDAFIKPDSFEKYWPEYKNLDELKAHYQRGGLGDVKIKKFLNKVLQEELRPIRERQAYWEERLPEVYEILKAGSAKAAAKAQQTLDEVKAAMRIDYFTNDNLLK